MSEEIIENTVEIPDAQALAYVKRYLETYSKTEAYLAIHPDSTRASAMSNTWEYWNSPKVQAALAYGRNELSMSIDEFIARITERARDASNKQAQIAALKVMKEILLPINRIDVTTNGKAISWEQIINNNGEAASFGAATVLEK